MSFCLLPTYFLLEYLFCGETKKTMGFVTPADQRRPFRTALPIEAGRSLL